jgi:type II secretory pathway component GspD/PulD (secretin)
MVYRKLLALLLIVFCVFINMGLNVQAAERKYDSGKKVYRLIPLRNVDYEIVDKVCRPWLDKDGVLTHEKKRNSILVYAEPEIIVKIRKFLDQTATPEYNIRIDIDKTGVQTDNTDRFEYRCKQPQPVVKYKDGKYYKYKKYKKYKSQKDPRLVLQSRRKTVSLNSKQFIMTRSGYPASLWVGKTIVDPSWLRQVIPLRRSTIGPNSYTITTDPPDMGDKMVDVGMSLYVLPRYLGNDLIEVEVYPEISKVVGKGKSKAVKVTSLVTKVVVKNGARVYIGGVIDQKREKYKNIFGPEFFKHKGISEVMDMYITATVLKPGESGRKSPFPIPRGRY